MNVEAYKTLSDKERLIYDEVFKFCNRLSVQQQEIIDILKKLSTEID